MPDDDTEIVLVEGILGAKTFEAILCLRKHGAELRDAKNAIETAMDGRAAHILVSGGRKFAEEMLDHEFAVEVDMDGCLLMRKYVHNDRTSGQICKNVHS